MCNEIKEYAKITFEESWFVCEPKDLSECVSDLEDGSFTIETVYMTEEQFEELPEFEGW